MRMPGLRYFAWKVTLRKKSNPIRVGSPPCQAKVTWGTLGFDHLAGVVIREIVGHAEIAFEYNSSFLR
jgi:hypothetical protein